MDFRITGLPAERFSHLFGLRDKLGYAFGDAGNDFTFILLSAFFMLFATNYAGVSPIVVGMIFLVVRHSRAEEESGNAELVRSAAIGRHAAIAATLTVALPPPVEVQGEFLAVVATGWAP